MQARERERPSDREGGTDHVCLFGPGCQERGKGKLHERFLSMSLPTRVLPHASIIFMHVFWRGFLRSRLLSGTPRGELIVVG